MSLVALLASERRRRKAAEAEIAQLHARLALTTAGEGGAPATAQHLVGAVGQLKQAEPQLGDQQDLVRQVIDTSPNLVYVENEAGQCVLANKSYAQLLSQRAPGDQPRRAATAPARPPSEWPINAATAFEESYQLRDGQTRWYQTTRSPLVRGDGSRYLLTFSSDITELKRACQLAEESGWAKQVFLANMSHEFRTPLHGVMGLAELLKKGALSAEQIDYVEMIHYSTEHLLLVIDDVLDFAKAGSGEIKLESIPFDLLKTVQQAARSLAFKTAEKGLHLRVEAPPAPLPLLQGDPYRLHQVLVNLIGNAVKFTPRGFIAVTIEAGEPTGPTLPVRLSVTDTGIGIGADNLDQVFDSFRQADSSIPRLYGGTGLGLAICKDLVERQGGWIGVRSTLGQGSCFHFTVPYAVSEQRLPKEPALSLPSDLLQGLTALVVEDNAINQLLAVSALGQWQVEVELAQNGEEALARAHQRQYDLILMDIQMPELDGIEAVSRLRREAGPNQRTPVVAVTADAIRINADSCQALGFADFLLKPYTEAALQQLLARVSSRGWATAGGASPPLAPVEPAAYPDSKPPHDFLALGKLGTDTAFIRRLLEMFVARVPSQVQALHEAVVQGHWAAAGGEAHKLKSTFGSLNIQPATEHLKRLEELAERQAPVGEMLPLMSAISYATEQCVARFLRDLDSLPPPIWP